jgi:general secretion pathway protein H
MLAVIALIGIAATVATVAVSRGLAAVRVRAASSDLAAALRYTRTQAIVHARSELFVLDVAARSYRAPGRAPKVLPAGMQLAVTSAGEDQIKGRVARIRFYPDGSSTGGHVSLRRGARTWRVDVGWLTGTVSVAER